MQKFQKIFGLRKAVILGAIYKISSRIISQRSTRLSAYKVYSDYTDVLDLGYATVFIGPEIRQHCSFANNSNQKRSFGAGSVFL